jgi:hypothetical protein
MISKKYTVNSVDSTNLQISDIIATDTTAETQAAVYSFTIGEVQGKVYLVPREGVSHVVFEALNNFVQSLEDAETNFNAHTFFRFIMAAVIHHQTAPQFLLTTSANEVGNIYGFSSPQYAIARILRPKSGGKLQSIPTYFWGIDQAVGAVAKAKQIVVSVNATGNATHYLRINGRTSLDGVPYAYSVVTGDTPAVVAQKMVDVCNAVVGCPVKATITSATVTFTAGWKGETSNRVTVEVETKTLSPCRTFSRIDTADETLGAPW